MSVLSKVNTQFSNKLPFVLYALPNSKKVCALLQTNDTVYQFKEQDGFIMAPFNSKEVLVIPNDASVFIEEDFKDNAIQSESFEISFNEIEKQDFERIVTLAVEQIKEGNFEKVVLSRSILVEIDVDCIDSFSKMVQRYPTAFCYVYYHPKIGCWMGATPEQLLKV
ncbi:MAG TPA: chorismate-binding protein, partial [Flavobacterium sp.]|nr:chorismate-binding protein [Flavobacterium sp.]